MFDRIPEPPIEPNVVDVNEQPGDICECGHKYEEHYGMGAACWNKEDDCGCRVFKLEYRPLRSYIYRPSSPAVFK